MQKESIHNKSKIANKSSIMMKKITLLVISILSIFTTKAQTADSWTMPDTLKNVTISIEQYNKMLKDFKSKDAMQIAFHYNDCKWRGMSIQEFNDMFAPEEMGYDDKNYTKRLLFNFNDIMQKESGLKVGNTAPFIVHIVVNKVEQDAAIDAQGLIVYNDTIPFSLINLSVEAGRWNKFSVLWRENVEKMARVLKKKIKEIRNPIIREGDRDLLIEDKW